MGGISLNNSSISEREGEKEMIAYITGSAADEDRPDEENCSFPDPSAILCSAMRQSCT